MNKVMGLFFQGYSDEEIMNQTGIDEETLGIIKERQKRMMDRAQQMTAMYGRPPTQQIEAPGVSASPVSTPNVPTPTVPTAMPRPIMAPKKKGRAYFFLKKQVFLFLTGLVLASIAAVIMGITSMQYTAFWWLIILETIAVNIVFQVIFGIVAFKSTFRSRTYKAAAMVDYDGDGKYDEAAFASKTVSGTSVKLKVLAMTFLIFILITVGIFTQFGISIQGIGTQTNITLGGDSIATFFVLHSLGALTGGYGLTRR